jgi:hypothetical protein
MYASAARSLENAEIGRKCVIEDGRTSGNFVRRAALAPKDDFAPKHLDKRT